MCIQTVRHILVECNHFEERSSTSVRALSEYSDNLPHFGGMKSSFSRKRRYIWKMICGGIVLDTVIILFCTILYTVFIT